MLQHGLNRASNVVFEAVQVTAVHLRRIVGLVASVVTRTTREVEDLVRGYQHLAGDLRDGLAGDGVDNVIPLDLHRHSRISG